jgi:aspartate aminotransferase
MSLLGTESAFEVLARAKALQAQGKSIVNLGIGSPDFRTPDNIVEAGHQGAARRLPLLHAGQGPARTAPGRRRRDSCAARCEGRPRPTCDRARRQADDVLRDLDVRRAGRGDPLPEPRLPDLRVADPYTGATPVPIELRERTASRSAPTRCWRRSPPRTRLLIVNTPANPTGGVVPKREIDRSSWKGLEKHPHVAVLSDEIYSRMTYDGEEHVSLLEYLENLRDR